MDAEKKRRVFIGFKNQGTDVIKKAIEAVGSVVNEMVSDPDQSDLIITSSSQEALNMIKETDATEVLVFILPGMNMQSELLAARSLKKAYPERVIIGRLFDPKEGEVLMVEYLLRLIDEGGDGCE